MKSVAVVLAVLSCANPFGEVQPVELHGSCDGYHCEAVAVGRGYQSWRWYWHSHDVDWTDGYDFAEDDSATVTFDFTLAAKVPYLIVVSLGDASDSLRWDFTKGPL